MGEKDPLGYYRVLGVQPEAPISVIKAAYRALAMDLHPDRNKDSNATAKFQAIQQAYSILSDEKLRQQYDANSSVPNSTSAKSKSDEGVYKPFEPIVCSKCNAITAQPRYKVFYSVYSYFIGAVKKPHQGIFCSKCEIKEGLQCSVVTLAAGWWSIPGFIWTCQSLLQNLIGGTFYLQNAKIQAHQAMYFSQIGKHELAKAMAKEALNLANKAKREGDKESRYKRGLGYENTNPAEDLSINITAFINSLPKG